MDTENTVEQRIADLEAKCVTIKELHDAATDERDALRVKVSDLERAAVKRREISDGVEAELVDECDTLRTLKRMAESERDALRARLAEIEAQEPICHREGPGNRVIMNTSSGPGKWRERQKYCGPLYARPVPAQAVPDGWRLVPVEPTQEMLDAAVTDFERERHAVPLVMEVRRASWSRMIAAAPEHKA